MENNDSFNVNHIKLILLAFLVTFLWSTSFVIIKFGLRNLNPLTFAGYRYITASILLIFLTMSNPRTNAQLKALNRSNWIEYGLYGLIFIALTQGTGFVSLKLLPAITVSFGLSLTIIIVIIISKILLQEVPNSTQSFFIILSLFAVLLFFYPLSLYVGSKIGLLVLGISLLSNSFSNIMGRNLNKASAVSPIVITSASMMFGSIGLLIVAQILEGLEIPNLFELMIILWLAIVNTALTFTLWNYVLQHLQAFEATIIQNSMLPQITILAWIFLGEVISWYQGISILIILTCSIMVQVNRNHKNINSKL